MANEYDHRTIETKWSERWDAQDAYHVDLARARRPYYNLMMFPYPSAHGLHVGNMYAFVGSDIHGRFRRAQGYDVFEPMGFDAFGIHSENYAMKIGQHPADLIPRNIATFRDSQLKRIGAMFDWSKQVDTTCPRYYRWTQWIFIKLVNAGLAYRQKAAVNWCPSCRTVLANEQAAGGHCERCGSAVEMRQMQQWFFRTTAYAHRLLNNLDWLDWSERTKAAQRHWIGTAQNIRLRDWCISRQRYWGPPIPIIYCERCGTVPVPEEQLPVVLPYINQFQPDGSGQSPLARDPAFICAPCPTCGQPARRETDVSDNFLDSAWYFLRYPSADRDDVPFDPDLTAKWLPVSMYIGGNEHAVLHLIYTRFITMALHDLGIIPFEEPFKRFRAHGIIVKDGAKMSKSRPQSMINPDSYIDRYGADTFRMYLMFMGPYQEGGDFRDEGITGIRRFLERVWRHTTATPLIDSEIDDPAILRLLHGTIQRVTDDMENLRYNTAISALMELLNALSAHPRTYRQAAITLLHLLYPFAPFIAHELLERLDPNAGSAIHWPSYEVEFVRQTQTQYAIQVNGRLRGHITVNSNAAPAEVEQIVRADPQLSVWLANHQIGRMIVVPGKLVSIVTT